MSSKLELNKKRAEWAGFVDIELVDYGFTKYYAGINPKGTLTRPIDFPKSLDACFRWLVPVALKRYPIRSIEFIYDKKGMACLITDWNNHRLARNKGWVKDEPIALCRAIDQIIDQLIDKEAKDE